MIRSGQHWVRATPLAATNAGGCTVVQVSGHTLAIVRDHDRLHVIDNRCPHMGEPMSLTELKSEAGRETADHELLERQSSSEALLGYNHGETTALDEKEAGKICLIDAIMNGRRLSGGQWTNQSNGQCHEQIFECDCHDSFNLLAMARV